MSSTSRISDVFRMPLTACCLFALALPLQAARKARAIFIQPPGGSLEKVILYTGTKGIEIELPQRNLSPEVTLPDGDLTLAVLTKLPAKDEVVDPKAPVIRMPAAWTRCIILFFPDPNNKVFPARVIPLNASTDQFPIGHTIVFNVTKATVMMKLGSEMARVNPGQTASVKSPVGSSGDYPVAIDCAFPGDKEVTPLCRSTWRHDPASRQILFITPEEGRNAPRIWGIQDRPEPEDHKKDAAKVSTGG